MASTMETWAKLVGGYGVLKGGISGFNNQMKKLGPEAQMERIQKKEQKKQDKEDAKIKKEAADEYVREHKDIKKRLQSGALTTQKAQEAHKKAVEDHTAKIQAMPTPAAKLPLVAGQDNKTGGPDVAGQDISGVDSVAIVTAIENQTVEIITELGTHSPKDAGSPKLEPDAKFTSDSPEDKLLGQVESIWGSAKEASFADADSPTMAATPKVSEPVPTDGPASSLLSTDTTGSQDALLEEVKETNVQLSPMKSALAE